MMGFKRRMSFLFVLVLVVCFFTVSGSTNQLQTITWQEALQLALERSPHYAFFLEEQKLSQEKEKLTKHPVFKITAAPAEIVDGVWQSPQAVLSATMPLGSALDLTGSVGLKSNPSLEAIPAGGVSLNYNPLAWQKPSGEEITPEEALLQKENELVLKTTNLLFQLRKELAQQAFLQERYTYLEKYLQAGEDAPNFDSLKQKEDLRDLAGQLVNQKDEIDLLQLQLASLLGVPGETRLDPVLKVKPYYFIAEFELYKEDFYNSNVSRRQALENLAAAEERLKHERKTGGWSLAVIGKAAFNDSWSVGLTASKTLYPRKIILQELELAEAQAKMVFLEQEIAVENELKTALKSIHSAADKIVLRQEYVDQASEDLELVKRRLQAGLITEWALEEAKMQLAQTKLEHERAQLDYVQKLLSFFGQCNVNLQQRIGELLK